MKKRRLTTDAGSYRLPRAAGIVLFNTGAYISAGVSAGGRQEVWMSWNNQGGGPWRSSGRGPWGQGPQPQAAGGSRGDHPPHPAGPWQADTRGVGPRRRRARGSRGAVRPARRSVGLARLGNVLYRPAERSRHQSRVRPLHRQDGRRSEHQLALADRFGDQGSGLGSADHRSGLSQPRREHGHSRRKPDADRGQQHGRRSLQGELADRPSEAGRLCFHHP